MKFWLAVLVIALGTFIYRYSFIGGRFKIELPELVKRGLEFVPVSVMATLVALGFFVGPDKSFTLDPASLATALAASAVAFRFRRDLLTIITGLAVYWLAQIMLH